MDVSLKTRLKRHLLAVLILSTLTRVVAEEEPPISVGAPVTAVALGDSAEIECTVTGNAAFAWYRGTNATEDTKISQNETSRVFANFTTGLLKIQNAVLADSGQYLCRTDDRQHNVTAELKAYETPSYMTEGMIIVGINVALVVLFVICGVHTYLQNRQKKKEDKAKPRRKILTEL